MTIAPQWIKDLYLQVADELCDGKEWCWHGTDEPLQRFAALVAAHEREACAKVCDVIYKSGVPSGYEKGRFVMGDAADCAAAIRARAVVQPKDAL